MEPVTTGFPGLLACAAGLVGSMPIGLVAGMLARSRGGDSSTWYAGALALLAIVPFVLALVHASATGRVVALALAGSVGFVVANIQGSAMMLVGFLIIPVVALALLLGIIALGASGDRVADGTSSLAILGMSPAGSCLGVYTAYLTAQLLQRSFPALLRFSVPVIVFGIAVAISVCAVFIAAMSLLRRRRATSSKSSRRLELHDFDRP